MKISNVDLIQEFFSSIKENFKDVEEIANLELSEMVHICSSPFIFTKKIMEKGTFESVRLQYLGIFQVYPKRVEKMLEKNKEMLSENRMTLEDFEKYNKNLLNFLNEKADS